MEKCNNIFNPLPSLPFLFSPFLFLQLSQEVFSSGQVWIPASVDRRLDFG